MDLAGLTLRELIRRTVRETWEDAVFGQGGRMAFYHFLAIFPALLMLNIAARHVPGLSSDVLRSFTEAAGNILPHDVVTTVRAVTEDFDKVRLPGWRFLTTLAGVLWAGCNGTWSMIYGLNTAYEVRDSRRPTQLAITIAALTVALALITTLALALIAGLAKLRSRMHTPVPLGIIECLVLIAVLLFWFSMLYRFGPDITHRPWKCSLPGAILAAVLWGGATIAARFYFEVIDDYHVSFGRLSGVAMLLLWLYVINGAVLIGGEMNSEIQKEAEDTHRTSPAEPHRESIRIENRESGVC